MVTDSAKRLRIAVLTTDTPHHVRFVQAIAERFDLVRVFEERRETSATFETHHPFEDDRDRYERDQWFAGQDRKLADFADVETHEDLNEESATASMKALAPDALVVFGTGKLKEPIINLMPERIVNLHGADPEHYRGLDTHLWAIYHGDFRNLVTTLHKVTAELDRGGVVMKMPLHLHRGMELYQLRKTNTDVCIDIATQGLEMLADHGQFISQPQLYVGRYYSFMPAVLKDRCVRKFREYTASL